MPLEHASVADAGGTDTSDQDQRDCLEDDLSQRIALKQEQNRLQTFRDWPSNAPVKPEVLARDGFYYLKHDDHVKCIFCNLILKSWQKGDIARNEHKKFNPTCPFLLNGNVGNVPVQTAVPSTSTGRGNVRLVPKFPEYSKPAAREGSFRNNEDKFTQSVDDLVEAGFFYTGIDDSVRCFHCGVVIRSWEPQDNPWAEHEHWSPGCHFLRTNTGPDDVFEITPVMKRVLSMGYDEGLVKSVVRRRRLSGAPEITDISELVEAVEQLKLEQQAVSRAHVGAQETGASGSSQTASGVPPSGASSSVQLDQRLCKICMERELEITFIPCGHFVACERCGAPLRKCPFCRKRIKSYVKTFMS